MHTWDRMNSYPPSCEMRERKEKKHNTQIVEACWRVHVWKLSQVLNMLRNQTWLTDCVISRSRIWQKPLECKWKSGLCWCCKGQTRDTDPSSTSLATNDPLSIFNSIAKRREAQHTSISTRAFQQVAVTKWLKHAHFVEITRQLFANQHLKVAAIRDL